MKDGWHRRHAIQIVASLPEDTADALLVLELARQLVVTFRQSDAPDYPAKPKVVTLVRDDLSA
jgi:hypothetical protein